MPDVNIVVAAYDKYSVVWPPFVHGFKKYWKDRPWNVAFMTQILPAPYEKFDTIRTGSEGWGDHVRAGLAMVDSDIILWMMDDFWLTGPVNTGLLMMFIDYMTKFDIDHIRLLPPAWDVGSEAPPGGVDPARECKHVSSIDSRLWVFKDDAEYRVSATIGLWKKDVFLKYMEGVQTPWEFESIASPKSYGNDRYLCNIDPRVFPISWFNNPYPNGKKSVMDKGKWTKSAYEYAYYEGLSINFANHPNGMPNEVPNTNPIIAWDSIRVRYPDLFDIGNYSIIDDFSYFSTKVKVGIYSHIAASCVIAGGKSRQFTLGNFCSIASGTKIYCGSNDFVNDLVILTPDIEIGMNMCSADVTIGDYCGVGTNSVIMPGNNIPEGTVIGGMSWVPSYSNLEPWSVYAGIPVKKIKDRNKDRVMKQVELMSKRLGV